MMQFESLPVPLNHGMHDMHARRTSMPSLHDASLCDVTQESQNQANRCSPCSPGEQRQQRRLSKKSKSDANLSRLTSQERKVDNLPRKAKSRLYKSELCKAFMDTGHCKYGGKCQYAHGQDELRFVQKSKNYKTAQCKSFWTTGRCKYGTRCCFVHNDLGGAFQQTPSPQLLSRAESQPAMSMSGMSRAGSQPLLFSPTIVEENFDERVEEDTSDPLWSDFTTSGGLDLNSIADCLVEDEDEQPQDLMDAFEMELTRAKARYAQDDYAIVCTGLEQRLGRKLSQDETNKVKEAFGGPEVSYDPSLLSAKAVEFTAFSRKHQSMPNVLSPMRTSSRLNVFAQLSTEERMANIFAGQAA